MAGAEVGPSVRRPLSTARGLALSCHPVPALAVTVFAGLLGVAAGDRWRSLLVAAAVLAGQLTIGWLNDLLDAGRDRQVGRTDKPVARGDVDVRTLRVGIACAAAAAVALAVALGGRAAVVDVITIACGWAYDLGLKATWVSFLPYAVAFGLLPAVATLTGGAWPAAWVVAAGALLGVAAHLANVLPDLADDAATGVRGLPHRLGRRTSIVVTAALLVAASLVVVVAPPGPVGVRGWLALTVVALVLPLIARDRWAFPALMAMVGADVLVLLTGGHLH